MKRNRESKYRQKLINNQHMSKQNQKCLDIMVQNYGATYYGMYQFSVRHNLSYLKDVIDKMVECEIDKVFRTFGDMSELSLDLFDPINNFRTAKRPYYLGVDFTRGNDQIGKITLNEMENR